MMSTPSVAQLIAAVRAQLSDAVAPAVADPGLQKVLGIIDHILQTAAVRAEHEIEWMVTHIDGVVEVARRYASEAGEDAAAVSASLAKYDAEHGDSLTTSVVTANFALAAEVLSTLLEATVADDGPTAVRARDLLRADVQRGVDIVGLFELVPP